MRAKIGGASLDMGYGLTSPLPDLVRDQMPRLAGHVYPDQFVSAYYPDALEWGARLPNFSPGDVGLVSYDPFKTTTTTET